MLCRWLASRPRRLGVEIYPGFAAAEVLEEDGRVSRHRHRRHGQRQSGQPGAEFPAPAWSCGRAALIFAEGCRGSLTERLMERLRNLRRGATLQVFEFQHRAFRVGQPLQHSSASRNNCSWCWTCPPGDGLASASQASIRQDVCSSDCSRFTSRSGPVNLQSASARVRSGGEA